MRLKMPLEVQVRRAAKVIRHGADILELVQSSRAALIEEAESGSPPVGAVSAALHTLFPKEVATAPVRQFVGTAVKSVLLAEGYEIAQTGVRLRNDPVFKTGATYRKTGTGSTVEDPVAAMLERLVGGLTVREARLLREVLQRRLRGED